MNEKKTSDSNFVGHLTELRSRLIKSVIFVFIFFVISYTFAENIYNFLVSNNSKEFESKYVSKMVLKKIIKSYNQKKQ